MPQTKRRPAIDRVRTMRLRLDGPDVWYAEGPDTFVGPADIAFLKERASVSPRERGRICLHEGIGSAVQEMIIVHGRSCYVRPARHPIKRETMTAIEGRAAVVFFDDAGGILRTQPLNSDGGGSFICRVPQNTWHGLVILSEWFVFYEVSAGPWLPGASEFPPWAPSESEPAAIPYLESLRAQVGTDTSNDLCV